MQVVIGFRQMFMPHVHTEIGQVGMEILVLLDPKIEPFYREGMAEIVDSGWIATDVCDAGFIPKQMEPVVDHRVMVISAFLVREENFPIREDTLDLFMILLTKLKEIFRHDHIAIFVPFRQPNRQFATFQVDIIYVQQSCF